MVMAKRTVLDVGNCGPDHASIRRMLSGYFDVEILQAHGPRDTLQLLRQSAVDLVLINRKLDQDYSDGVEVLRLIKSDPEVSAVPVMIVTNLAEHQAAAIALGAEAGFGKLELQEPATRQKLAAFLE